MAKGIYYVTSDGGHRLRFNIKGSFSVATSSPEVAITGVTFTAKAQAVTITGPNNWARAYTVNSAIYGDAGATATGYYFSGDVELASKPSWA